MIELLERRTLASALLLILAGVLTHLSVAREAGAEALGTAISYQGHLTDNGSPVNGSFDFRFAVFDASLAGSRLGRQLIAEDLFVRRGLFSLALDFGPGVFSGDSRWLELEIRPGDSTGAYTLLSPRQRVAPSPYAIKAQEESLFSRLLTGMVTVAPGSDVVTGTGTLFEGEVGVGDALLIADETFTVSTISSDLELMIDRPHGVGALDVVAAVDGDLLEISNGDNVNKVVVDRSGRFGIGVSDPQSALDVAGRIRFDCSLCLGWGPQLSVDPVREICFDMNGVGRVAADFLELGSIFEHNSRLWMWMQCP